jgi:hypothetical protein
MRHLVIVPLFAACLSAKPADNEVQLDGSYQLANHIDLASAGILPDIASTTLEQLSKLKTDPAGAIIGILQASNAPVASTLLSALPAVIKQQLATFIDDSVFAAVYQGAPVTEQIAGVISDIASLVTAFQLDTQLDLTAPDPEGAASATHALVGVTFTVADKSLVVRAPELLSAATQGSCDATALHIVERASDVENGVLDLHDHALGLPLGDFTIHGIDLLVQAKLGQPTLRAALGTLVNCSAVAKDVSTRCVGPVCVGHESDIENLCNAGLDAIVADVDTQLKALNIKTLHFHDGEAEMWDAASDGSKVDGIIDRLDHGVWTLGVDIGTGEHPAHADFTGVRIDASTTPQQ